MRVPARPSLGGKQTRRLPQLSREPLWLFTAVTMGDLFSLPTRSSTGRTLIGHFLRSSPHRLPPPRREPLQYSTNAVPCVRYVM